LPELKFLPVSLPFLLQWHGHNFIFSFCLTQVAVMKRNVYKMAQGQYNKVPVHLSAIKLLKHELEFNFLFVSLRQLMLCEQNHTWEIK